MSADLLRKAAREMRGEGGAWLSVADWLDREAEALEKATVRMVAFYGPKAGLDFVRNADPDALAVARAYLGTDT